jgi:hypothetical protein
MWKLTLTCTIFCDEEASLANNEMFSYEVFKDWIIVQW